MHNQGDHNKTLFVLVTALVPNDHFQWRTEIDCNLLLFQMLHQLAARAVIRDWEDGSLHADRTQHEVCPWQDISYEMIGEKTLIWL